MADGMDRFRRRVDGWISRSPVVAVAWDALRGFFEHEGPMRAAAIAYYSVLAIFPTLMLLLIGASELLENGVSLDRLLARAAQELGVPVGVLHTTLDAILAARGAIVGLSVVLLLVAVVPWGSAVQLGIIRAFGEERRSVARSTAGNLLILAAAGLLLLWIETWGVVLALVARALAWLFGSLPGWHLALAAAAVLVPAAVVFGVMAVLLRAIPSPHPAFRQVWQGAAVTAIGFTVVRLGFEAYAAVFLTVADLGGTVASLVVGLIFVDFLAVSVLVGAEVAAASARRSRTTPADVVPPR